MQTDEQIVAEIRRLDKDPSDFFGFIRSDLIGYLPFGAAREWLKDDASESEWTPTPRDREAIRQQIIDYLPFAWDKANNCRGLSAGRSINHMRAWLWMLGEEQAAASLDGDYELYGKPQLRAISEAFGFDWRAADDGRWSNHEDGDGLKADSVPAVPFPYHAEQPHEP